MWLDHTTPKQTVAIWLEFETLITSFTYFGDVHVRIAHSLLGDHSGLEPPDPIPNSEVKRISADGSVGSPHVRVGHRQALIMEPPVGPRGSAGGFLFYTRSISASHMGFPWESSVSFPAGRFISPNRRRMLVT